MTMPSAEAAATDRSVTAGVGPSRAADRVFLGSLVYTAALALVWLFFLITQRDGGLLFRNYNVTIETVQRLVAGFAIFWFGWGWLWYRIKRVLLSRVVGLSKDELTANFASRMGTPFDLPSLLANHSERRIRIVDMIARRGRTVLPLLAGFTYFYFHISKHPVSESLTLGIQDNFLDAIALSAALLACYYSSGLLGRVFYGAHARIMDGRLGRANVLLIAMMWTLFKFVMIPMGVYLAKVFPTDTYAALFAFIWVSYVASDTLSEVVGSLFGKQKLRVWGLGDVNRKSVAGTWACFLGSLAVCCAVVFARHLPLPWLGLAVVISLSNTLTELYSPRGTDDFTMATANGLLCCAFGALVYQ
jgi:dolichol kinase